VPTYQELRQKAEEVRKALADLPGVVDLRAEGQAAEEAVGALVALVERDFDEGDHAKSA